MTWLTLVRRNLLRRATRTALTAAGVAAAVGLIVALLSISAGVRKTANDLIHVGRADFGLFQKGASDLTRSLLPGSLARRLEREPGVAAAARVFLYVTTVEGRDSFLVFGLAADEFAERRFVVLAGRRPRAGEAMVGDLGARALGLGVGDRVRVGGRALRVSGIFHSGNRFEDGGLMLPLERVQALAGRPGEVTSIGVEVAPGVRPKALARRLERRYPGLAALTEPGQAVKVDTSSRLIVNAGWIFSLLALVVGGIGVANTMAMAVFERTRELGILRAVGWRPWRIGSLILSEALALAALALAAGLLVGWAAAILLTRGAGLSRLVEPAFTAGVFAWGLAFASALGVAGALYPAWLAMRLTPVEALRRE